MDLIDLDNYVRTLVDCFSKQNSVLTYDETNDRLAVKVAEIRDQVHSSFVPLLIITKDEQDYEWSGSSLIVDETRSSYPSVESLIVLSSNIPTLIDCSILKELTFPEGELGYDWPLIFPSMTKLSCKSIKWHELLERFDELECLKVLEMETTMGLSRYPNLVHFDGSEIKGPLIIDYIPPSLKYISLGHWVSNLPDFDEASKNLEYFSSFKSGYVHPYAILCNDVTIPSNYKKNVSLVELLTDVEPFSRQYVPDDLIVADKVLWNILEKIEDEVFSSNNFVYDEDEY